MLKIDWSHVILKAYTQSWFMWVGFIIVGFLILKFSEQLSVSYRDRRKKENAGIGMIGVGVSMHIFVIIAFFTK